jgi:rhodanese-related sulfurtransferase
MDKEKKEHLALSLGFILILFVLIITLFRRDALKNKNSQVSQTKNGITIQDKTADYQTVGVQELQKKLSNPKEAQKISLLDIRSFDDYIQEHIIDAINVSLDEFPVGNRLDKQNTVIIIGVNKSDADISKAMENLKKEDFKNILVLAGGMENWKKLLGQTVTYGDPKSFVDQTKVAYLNPEDLRSAMDSQVPVYIIDVRSASDFAKGHVKGAINIPFDDLEEKRKLVTERRAVILGSNELQEFQASVQLYDMLGIQPFIMRTAVPGWQSKGYELVK